MAALIPVGSPAAGRILGPWRSRSELASVTLTARPSLYSNARIGGASASNEGLRSSTRWCASATRPSARTLRRGEGGTTALRGSWSAIGKRRCLAEGCDGVEPLGSDGRAGRSSDRAARAGPHERSTDRASDPSRPGDCRSMARASGGSRRAARPAARELVAFVQEMARNVRGNALAGWLDASIDVLAGANPLDEIAEGRYSR